MKKVNQMEQALNAEGYKDFKNVFSNRILKIFFTYLISEVILVSVFLCKCLCVYMCTHVYTHTHTFRI